VRHTFWDPRNFPDSEEVLDVCPELLELDGSGYVRFIHGSIKEFFDYPPSFDRETQLPDFLLPFEERQRQVAQACLSYLQFDDFECGSSRSLEEIKTRFAKYKLLDYAAKHWSTHFRGECERANKEQWTAFLNMGEQKRASWLEACYLDPQALEAPGRITVSYGAVPKVPEDNKAILLASMLGFERIIDHLKLEHETADPRVLATNSRGATALFLSIWWEHHPIALKLVLLMTTTGINVQNIVGWTAYGLALSRGGQLMWPRY
jgi:hypothetical protein